MIDTRIARIEELLSDMQTSLSSLSELVSKHGELIALEHAQLALLGNLAKASRAVTSLYHREQAE